MSQRNGNPDRPVLRAVDGNRKLVNPDETIVITSRDHMDELIASFALEEWDGTFPASHKELEYRRNSSRHNVLTYREIEDEGSHGLKEDDRIHQAAAIGLDFDRLQEAVDACVPGDDFDKGTFTVWTPQKRSPYVLESKATPEEWLVHCDYGVVEFFEQFGVTGCDSCSATWDENRLTCPDCGERPATVESEIRELRRQHDGVACIIGPTAVDPRTPYERLRQWVAESYKSGKRTLKGYIGTGNGT
ncbi:MAG: hypothetical protein SVU32_06920 [Candidatus Nanohaloarchaea archaeon]|nr:hypothetical protein [Candidatus Nanohaloarchaea archaeon]